MDEKRKTERNLIEGELQIYSNDGSRTIGEGRVVDLSEGGMRMISSNKLTVGEKFSLHFSIPNSWNLDFFGNIVHKEAVADSTAYGVQFLAGQDTYILKLLANARSGGSRYLSF
jgi:phage gp45-like